MINDRCSDSKIGDILAITSLLFQVPFDNNIKLVNECTK